MAEYTEQYDRDGTSKRRRKLPALDPATAPVDERTVTDWLAFLQEFAGELTYFDLDNKPAGAWTPPFYPSASSYDQAKANEIAETGDPAWWPENWRKTLENYLSDPEHFPLTEEQHKRITAPHHTLLLAFLQLLRAEQERINNFPRRLLDFYYREYLQFKPKPPQPDQVHILVDLARGVKQAHLPAGSRLDAGMGPDKAQLVYATDREMFFNPARVEQVRSLYRDTTKEGLVIIKGDLWAAPDATKVLSAATAGLLGNTGWKTFGASPREAPGAVEIARTGLAICSPILWLEGGTRSITLTIGASDAFPEGAGQAFDYLISTAEGMKTIPLQPPTKDDKLLPLTLTFNLDASFPSVVPLSPDTAGEYWESPAPVLAIVLRQEMASLHTKLTGLSISSIRIEVRVGKVGSNGDNPAGLPNCQIENDEGPLDPKKAFEPFTNRPKQGRNFYLTHPELSAKSLDTVRIDFLWADLPWGPNYQKGFFVDYYSNYDTILSDGDDDKIILLDTNNPPPVDLVILGNLLPKDQAEIRLVDPHKETVLYENDDVKMILLETDTPPPVNMTILGNLLPKDQAEILLVDRQKKTVLSKDVPLLTTDAKTILPQGDNVLSPSINIEPCKSSRHPYVPSGKTVTDADSYLIIRLNGDFGNELYPLLLNKQMRDGVHKKITLNPPYIPKSNGLSVGYVSSLTLNLNTLGDKSSWDTLYHLHPFGYRRITESAPALLPEYPNAGELYIGLRGLTPPQTLSLLIQMVDGSANPDRAPAKIPWSYLSPDGWQNLDEDKQIIEDKTSGLLQSGILLLDIPAGATTENTLLPRGLVWLRAAIGTYADTAADIQALHTQAVRATLLQPESHPLHLQKPLPPNTVKGLIQVSAGIAKIHQPYISRGGAPVEAEADYFVRCSERLRHKQRALTPWDYEHLVLDAFPGIYLAKCIPATTVDDNKGTTVQLLVVPDIRNTHAYNPFEPKVPSDTLVAISRHLEPYVPPFTKISTRNAIYEPVQVRAMIRLKKGYYETRYYKEQTNRAIQRYLSPWAFQEGADISLGGRLYVSNLIHFVENLEWVEYVKNIYLKNTRTEQIVGMMSSQSYLETSGLEYIWASTPEHYVAVLPPEGAEPLGTGIEFMIVEYDFQIGQNKNA